MRFWAFVDYENMGSLGKGDINLRKYEKIYLFMGAKQALIQLPPLFDTFSPPIQIIKIRDVSKNNLDFHLVWFMGTLFSTRDEGVCFEIISHDMGYQGIANHMCQLGQKCTLYHPLMPLLTHAVERIVQLPMSKRPKTRLAIVNQLKSYLKKEHCEEWAEHGVTVMETQQIVIITNNTLRYLK